MCEHILSLLALICLITVSQGTHSAIFWRHSFITVMHICLVLSATYDITSDNMK